MKKIDWSEAPEWATKHGIVGTYLKYPIWFNETQYTYCDKQQGGRTFLFSAYSVYKPNKIYAITERPAAPQWNGEGPPPVGTVCEYRWSAGVWRECHVFAHKTNANRSTDILIDIGDDWTFVNAGCASRFRPIRTPEQIAAEEREKAIDEMIKCMSDSYFDAKYVAETLYGAGYRKLEQCK